MGALSPDGIGRLTADLRPKANVPLFVSKPRSPCFAIFDRPCIVIWTVFTVRHNSFNRIELLYDFIFSVVLKTFAWPVYGTFSSSKEEQNEQIVTYQFLRRERHAEQPIGRNATGKPAKWPILGRARQQQAPKAGTNYCRIIAQLLRLSRIITTFCNLFVPIFSWEWRRSSLTDLLRRR